jgi:hypothetical protein
VKRRHFITLLSGAAAWPLAARAQRPGKLPTIGFVGAGTASTYALWAAAFVQRLRELGWIVLWSVTWFEARPHASRRAPRALLSMSPAIGILNKQSSM